MVRCPDCETPNSVDSKFCRFCGASLPEEERVDAQMKLNELIAEGNKLYNDGRTDEALLIAESAISSSPNDTRALSLKGMCLESTGNLADALELYERVVELNPDSALDKIKVTHVRNRLAAKVAEPQAPNRRVAIFGAAAAVVLVMAIGAIIAAAATNSTPKTASAKRGSIADDAQVSGFENPATQAPQQQQQPSGNQAANQNPNPNGGANTNTTPPPSIGRSSGITPLPVVGPIDSGSGVATTAGGGPDAGLGPKPTEPPNKEPSKGVDPEPNTPTTPSDPPKEDHGYVQITVHNVDKHAGGAQNVDDPNQLKSLIKAGREQFQLRDYQAAARTFERAVKAGGDPAFLNQRIGQCYMNLGEKSEAINAYTKAVEAFQAEISRHDSPTLRTGLEACKQALKVLQG